MSEDVKTSEEVVKVKPAVQAGFGTIIVNIHYEGFSPWKFVFKRALSKRLKDLKQAFYNLTPEQQVAQTNEHRITILSESLKEHPEGISELGYTNTGLLDADFIAFFGQEEYIDILDSLWTLYQGKVYPKELLRDSSE